MAATATKTKDTPSVVTTEKKDVKKPVKDRPAGLKAEYIEVLSKKLDIPKTKTQEFIDASMKAKVTVLQKYAPKTPDNIVICKWGDGTESVMKYLPAREVKNPMNGKTVQAAATVTLAAKVDNSFKVDFLSALGVKLGK